MGIADDNYKRQVVREAVAQSAWDLVNQLPLDLTTLIEQDIVTTQALADYWLEELEKLV